MEDCLLRAWGLRRVLLAGRESAMMHAITGELDALGARILRLPAPIDQETACRALQAGKTACVIVPSLPLLGAGSAPPGALDTLLAEAREAGVPLVMLLMQHGAQSAACLQHLQQHASGRAGDVLSIQCIHHGPPSPDTCLQALRIGARYLMGDTACTGFFSLI